MSLRFTREIELRDGRTATLRRIEPEDAPGLMALDRAVVEAGHGVLRSVEGQEAQWARMSELGRQRLADRVERDPEAREKLQLVAILDGRLVGEASIDRSPMEFCRGSTLVSVEVHPEAQRLGLGRALMVALLDWAQAATDPPVHRVGLFARADNHRAIALYESLGFVHEGLRRDFARLPDGTLVDDVVMALLLG